MFVIYHFTFHYMINHSDVRIVNNCKYERIDHPLRTAHLMNVRPPPGCNTPFQYYYLLFIIIIIITIIIDIIVIISIIIIIIILVDRIVLKFHSPFLMLRIHNCFF